MVNNHGFGGSSLKIRDVIMDFELCFKVHNLVYVQPKRIKLGQTINLNVIFHAMVSIYRLLQIWNSPQFPAQLRNGLKESDRERFPFAWKNREEFSGKRNRTIFLGQNGTERACSFYTELLFKRLGTND